MAIIDSVYEIPDQLEEDFEIKRTINYVPRNVNRSNPHGKIVTGIIASGIQNIELYFYRVFNEEGKFAPRRVIRAFHQAHAVDKVDIINFSGGVDHSNDGNSGCSAYKQPCKLRKAARKAIDDGTVVVAAAGDTVKHDHMACPAILDDVISVGGFVPKCATRLNTSDDLLGKNLQTKPPNAGWIEPPEGAKEDLDEYNTDLVVCTGHDCLPSPTSSCDKCRKDVPWTYNVPSYRNKPDTLAPAVMANQGYPSTMASGSSWAAPFATLVAGLILSGAKSQKSNVSPQELRKGIRKANRPLDDGTEKMLNATGAIEYIFNQKELDFSIDWGDTTVDTTGI